MKDLVRLLSFLFGFYLLIILGIKNIFMWNIKRLRRRMLFTVSYKLNSLVVHEWGICPKDTIQYTLWIKRLQNFHNLCFRNQSVSNISNFLIYPRKYFNKVKTFTYNFNKWVDSTVVIVFNAGGILCKSACLDSFIT